MFVVSSVVLLLYAGRTQREGQYQTALAAARTYSESLAAFRAFYIREVAPSDVELDLLESPSPHSRLAALTDPYTNVLNLAEGSSSLPSAGGYRVFSRFPWSIRPTGGPTEPGEHYLLDALSDGISTEAVYLDTGNEDRELYYGVPIVMQETCVHCHNNHPGSPKTDWRVGDVRGVQSVKVSLPRLSMLGLFNMNLQSGVTAAFAVLFLGTLGLVVVISRGARQWQIDQTANDILQGIGESVFVVDSENQVVMINEATASTFGYLRGELVGAPIDKVLRNIPDDPGQSIESVGRRNDQQEFPCLVSVSELNGGAPARKIVTVRDISTQHRLSRELQLTHHMNAVGRLTAGVAHGFNNILATVLGSNEVIKGRLQAKSESIGGQLGAIERAVERGARITDALVKFSQRDRFEREHFDVVQALANVETLLNAAAPEEIAICVESSEPRIVTSANQQRLENALLALAMNGIDAIEESGEVTLRATIRRDDESQADCVAISVIDTGEGIPPDQVDRVWDPFYTGAHLSEGRGLGLSTVYGFVKQCDGIASLESEIGVGTTVTILLPRVLES